jgi:hypothetical protein
MGSRFEEAMDVLTPAMELDVHNGNMIGYALKQCLIGTYHIKHNDLDIAERVLHDLLKFIRTQKVSQPSVADLSSPMIRAGPGEERESAEQIALYCIAMLRKEQQVEARLVESALLHAITKNNCMHVESTSKALIALKTMFATEDRKKHIQQLNWLATEFNLNVDRDTSVARFGQNIASGAQLPKRVMFCLDYSAAVGAAFQATLDNVNTIFELHMNAADTMSIIYFNHKIDFALPPTVKKGNELRILDSLERMMAPTGERVAMCDAVVVSIHALSLEYTTEDWLVLVTCSDDTASYISLEKTVDKVINSKVGLIVIGIGEGVQTAALELLAGSTSRCVYFAAKTDKKSINEAFEHAIRLIEMSCSGENDSSI